MDKFDAVKSSADYALSRSKVSQLRSQATYYAALLNRLPADFGDRPAVEAHLSGVVLELVEKERSRLDSRYLWWMLFWPVVFTLVTCTGSVAMLQQASDWWHFAGWVTAVVTFVCLMWWIWGWCLTYQLFKAQVEWWIQAQDLANGTDDDSLPPGSTASPSAPTVT